MQKEKTNKYNQKSEKENEKDKKGQYKKEMEELTKSIRMNFVDCYYFNKCNKMFGTLMILFQLMQSMGFNGLFDLPSVFMILLSFAFIAFRKSFKVWYGFSNAFLSLYI